MAHEVEVQRAHGAPDRRIGFVFHLVRRNRLRAERAFDAGPRSTPDPRRRSIRQASLANELTSAFAQLGFEASQCGHGLSLHRCGHFRRGRISYAGNSLCQVPDTAPRPMPELPDLTVYTEALRHRILGQRLERLRINSPFLLRTVEPAIETALRRRVTEIRRIGKRIAIGLEDDLWLVLHLMIAGRLHWFEQQAPRATRATLAQFGFERGTLTLTEAGTKRRASLHLVRGERDLRLQDRGGIEVLEAAVGEFGERLRRGNHTLKRALSDPRLFSGIGNAYSDEILHAARLSPVMLTSRLDDAQIERLYAAAREQLRLWTQRLREIAGGEFPENVTAFRDGMAVHGRFGLPCPVCGSPVQRIRYAENETNYCARCQTGGRLLADRALSRLLKEDWPRSIDEL